VVTEARTDEPPGDFYDRTGKRIKFSVFTELRHAGPGEELSYARVALSQHGYLTISTVWLGWPEGTNADGEPLIFETALDDGDGIYIPTARYATEAEALAGHARIIGTLRLLAPLCALEAP
jgi:hypothetical protein